MLEPFEGYVVSPRHAASVVTAPYDMLTPRERRQRAEHPDSFLAVLPPSDADAVPERLEAGRARIEQLIATGRFVPLGRPVLGVLALSTSRGEMTGVIGDVPTSAFGPGGRIRPHERTRHARVQTLARYLDTVRVASSPVCVTHRPDAGVDRLVAEVRAGVAPVVDHADPIGRVRLWVVDDVAVQRRLVEAVSRTRDWLLADGHHRAAAAAPVGRVLTVLVSDDDLRIRPFHRRCAVESPERAATILRASGLEVTSLPAPSPPLKAGEVTVAGAGSWWRVVLPDGDGTPLGDLDVSRVATHVLAPLLGVGRLGDDALTQRRVEAVPPTAPLAGLPTPGHVGVALAPPTMEQVRRVVGAQATLPAKTTYVVPKQRAGLLVVPR